LLGEGSLDCWFWKGGIGCGIRIGCGVDGESGCGVGGANWFGLGGEPEGSKALIILAGRRVGFPDLAGGMYFAESVLYKRV
jgi:hypothetical protein